MRNGKDVSTTVIVVRCLVPDLGAESWIQGYAGRCLQCLFYASLPLRFLQRLSLWSENDGIIDMAGIPKAQLLKKVGQTEETRWV